MGYCPTETVSINALRAAKTLKTALVAVHVGEYGLEAARPSHWSAVMRRCENLSFLSFLFFAFLLLMSLIQRLLHPCACVLKSTDEQ